MTILHFNLLDGIDVSVVGFCCRCRQRVQATTCPPCPRAAPVLIHGLPLGCSALDYEVLLANAPELLYECTRQGKVEDIWFILDIWSRQRLHLACANGHTGLVQLLLSRGTTNIASNGSGNPRLNKSKVEKEELNEYQRLDQERRAMEYTLYDKQEMMCGLRG
jgi:hypothetical protein